MGETLLCVTFCLSLGFEEALKRSFSIALRGVAKKSIAIIALKCEARNIFLFTIGNLLVIQTANVRSLDRVLLYFIKNYYCLVYHIILLTSTYYITNFCLRY